MVLTTGSFHRKGKRVLWGRKHPCWRGNPLRDSTVERIILVSRSLKKPFKTTQPQRLKVSCADFMAKLTLVMLSPAMGFGDHPIIADPCIPEAVNIRRGPYASCKPESRRFWRG
jgi:hypothetical protein